MTEKKYVRLDRTLVTRAPRQRFRVRFPSAYFSRRSRKLEPFVSSRHPLRRAVGRIDDRPRKDFNLDRARQERKSRRARAKAERILRARVFLRNEALKKFLLFPLYIYSPTNFISNGLPSLLYSGRIPAFYIQYNL